MDCVEIFTIYGRIQNTNPGEKINRGSIRAYYTTNNI